MSTAQSAALVDEVTAVNILGRQITSTVQLIQALGGGWDQSTLPEHPECCGRLSSNSKCLQHTYRFRSLSYRNISKREGRVFGFALTQRNQPAKSSRDEHTLLGSFTSFEPSVVI